MPKDPIDIYRTKLSSKINGIPQFIPEPDENLPAAYRDVGVTIGDVGMWSEDGSFDVLFNACQPKNCPINLDGVPKGFDPYHIRTRDISKRLYHSPGAVIASAEVTKVAVALEGSAPANPFVPVGVGIGFNFKVSSGEGAILVLPEGATREQLLAVEPFRVHAIRHAMQWYDFACPRLRRDNSLFVVTGCDKTTSWGIATVSDTSRAIGASLNFTVATAPAISLSTTYQWKDYGSATVHVSNDDRSPRTSNQCVFIRGFTLVRKEPWWRKRSLKGLSRTAGLIAGWKHETTLRNELRRIKTIADEIVSDDGDAEVR